MKKIVIGMAMVGMLSSLSLAAGRHPMAGCGLLYMLGARDNSSKAMQTCASTWNNFYGTQSFGITSGTAGCTESGMVSAKKEFEVFVEVNLEVIRHEIAKGDGPYLSALASLLGASTEKVPALMAYLHASYGNLFSSPATDSYEFIQALEKMLGSQKDLLS